MVDHGHEHLLTQEENINDHFQYNYIQGTGSKKEIPQSLSVLALKKQIPKYVYFQSGYVKPAEPAVQAQMRAGIEEAIVTTINAIWTTFDADDNGYLSREEAFTFVKFARQQLGETTELSLSEFDLLFKEIDSNNSGTISREEMKTFLAANMGL